MAFLQLLDGALGERVAVARAVRDDVEQHHREAGVGDVGGDAGAHHAGAEDADLGDARSVGAGHGQTASSTVAMPWPPPMHWVATA